MCKESYRAVVVGAVGGGSGTVGVLCVALLWVGFVASGSQAVRVNEKGASAEAVVEPRASAPTWYVVPSPKGSSNPSVQVGLTAVSCASANSCMAVGQQARVCVGRVPHSECFSKTITELWNGARWSLLPSPNERSVGGSTDDSLSGVSCAAAHACVAVGSSGVLTDNSYVGPLIESWDGRTWSIVRGPHERNGSTSSLRAVTCVSRGACTAVGSLITGSGLTKTLVEHWDGKMWSVVPSPNALSWRARVPQGEFYGVSCTSASSCTAVGWVGTTLIEHWDGKTWSVVPSPNAALGPSPDPVDRVDDQLNGVSCPSTSYCVAVGTAVGVSGPSNRAIVESWNGLAWSLTPNPSVGSGSSVNGVSCMSQRSCTAVGSIGSKPLIESWDGTRWFVEPESNRWPTAPGFASRGVDVSLVSVSCSPTGACMAIGSDGGLIVAESY